jgi:hypothetical protein
MIVFNPNVKAIPFNLSGGEKSGPEACEIIKQIANSDAGKKNPIIRNLAVNIVSNVESNDYPNEAKKVYYWVRDNIRYVRDIYRCETLQYPCVTLPCIYSDQGIGAGDCDDHVILLASLLLAIGAKDLKMRIVKYKKTTPEWNHIYLVITFKGVEYAMDAINKRAPFGWEVNYVDKKDIPL